MSATKLITITETDVEFRKGLAEILISEGAAPVVFEVPADYDLNSYEGLALFTGAQAQKPEQFTTKFPEVAAWLEAYTGTFEFYLSLKSQLAAKGMLSEKQIACVQRAIEKDKASGKSTPAGKARTFSLIPGEVLVMSKFISNKIAQQAGHKRAHQAFEVVAVEAETAKAYRATVKLSARRTSFCGVCGLYLENPQSVAAGIGPICADKLGISFGDRSLEELHSALDVTAEVTCWLPKSAIKARFNADGIQTYAAKKPKAKPVTSEEIEHEIEGDSPDIEPDDYEHEEPLHIRQMREEMKNE